MKTFLIVLLVLVLGVAAWYFLIMREPVVEVAVTPPVLTEESEPVQPAQVPVQEQIEEVLDSEFDGAEPFEPVAEAAPLPALAESDPVVLESLSGLVGEAAVTQYVVAENIVSRLVATIDMLTGKQVSANLLPVQPMDSAFEANVDFDPPTVLTSPQGDPLNQYLVDPVNYARYTPYVELLESSDMAELATTYKLQQPLFQQAYTQLGYPQGDFSTRLLEIIDLMLAAPEPSEPVRLVKPEAYYRYADPQLEALPAGQKLMIRMGSGNARRVKAKLREFRAALETL